MIIDNSPSGSISTWDKAKDAALVGFLALASVALVKLMTDVSELKTGIAVYQARQEALAAELTRMRGEMDTHFRDDRTKFQTVGVK